MKTFLQPLSKEEEEMYLEMLKNGKPQESQKAKDILTERNLRLVAHIVKKYQNTDVETEDLLSIGTIGLIKAILSYDSSKNSKLATYAAKCIENAILSQMRLYVPKKSPLVKSILVGGYLQNFQRIIFLCAKLKMVS